MIIKNGYIHTQLEPPFQGDIQVEDGKIVAIERQIVPGQGEEVIDANGLQVFPGLVDAHTHLGIVEEGIGFEGADHNERSHPLTPNMRGMDGFNPQDSAILESAMAGVTAAAVGPGSANVIGGLYSLVKLKGDKADDMCIKEGIGMKCAFGENAKRVFTAQKRSPNTRMAIAAELREILYKTKEYVEKQDRYQADPDQADRPSYDMKLEALAPVIRGDLPLKVHAHRADDISTAMRICKEFDLNMTIDHCSDGHLIADHIAQGGYDCIVGPTLGFRTKPETRNKTFRTPSVLLEKGLRVAITTDHPVIPLRELRICAAYAGREGLGIDEAMKAITLYPAQIMGVEDRIGSLAVGMDADIVLWTGHPFDIFSTVERTIIDGETVYDSRA